MKKIWKKRWLKALRSGKYKQTAGTLRDAYGFCCLGVLCDVVAKHENKKWRRNTFSGEMANLPEYVSELVGIEGSDPDIKYKYDFVALSYLNDSEGLDFNELADLIEKQL